ncbi:fibrillarin-like rRNA/tRNA 2'-O-methyltransferase [Methanobacterium alcaliphilum]|nr:fibrillarin-like rRNA/tRNA 2'-O-methyltransferase [Methanobacterium alcaliphilum]
MNQSLVTPNLILGEKVYGEKLLECEGQEYRVWDPRRSKLGAAILNGLTNLDLSNDSKILYLGASSGTTPSHLSDMVPDGLIYCLEFSPRMMRELLRVCEKRKNMIPLLDDATRPKKYLNLVEKVDFIYCDVAQPRQSELFMENMRLFLKDKGQGMLMIKARSIDVTKKPQKIFREEESKLKTHGFNILEKIKLEPYEKDHLGLLVEIGF